jgi:hypothetical protein
MLDIRNSSFDINFFHTFLNFTTMAGIRDAR